MNEQNYCKNTLRVSWKCFPIKNIGQMPIVHCELALVNWKDQLLQTAKFTQNTPRLMVSLPNTILEIQTLSLSQECLKCINQKTMGTMLRMESSGFVSQALTTQLEGIRVLLLSMAKAT